MSRIFARTSLGALFFNHRLDGERGHAAELDNPHAQAEDARPQALLEDFQMAKKSMIAKAQRAPKFKSRVVRRCFKCGRPRGFLRDFNLCRICFREEALEGNIPGIKKSSW